MGDAESNQPSKKRAAGVQLTRENLGRDDDNEEETFGVEESGTFKRASEDVLATRRIVKVRRQQTPSSSSAPFNPFAAIQLVFPPQSAEQTDEIKSQSKNDEPKGENPNPEDEKADKKSESEMNNANKEESDGSHKLPVEGVTKNAIGDDKGGVNASKDVKDKENGDENAEKKTETASFSSFHQLSSGQNAFSGLSGTGFSSSSFSFGSSSPSNNETPSIFGNSSVSNAMSKNEVCVETGEENEETVFAGDSILFEYIDGGWKERGKGELKVNVSTSETGKARLVMRARGNYRLILNASLFPDMKLTNMDKKGVTFACVNSAAEGKDGLSTIALKFREVSFVEDFKDAVMENKGSKSSDVEGLKTPGNSPKAE